MPNFLWKHLYLQEHSFCSKDEYHYKGYDQPWYDSKCDKAVNLKGYKEIPEGDEEALLTELANGPISVAVDAEEWSYYEGGIIEDCGTDLGHGVTLVKYNSEEKTVTFRNSWSSDWGENGHIRLRIGNTWGYANEASYPVF